MSGPDFSNVDSREKAEAMAARGELERLLLLPAAFGGEDIPQNVVYVPLGLAGVKAGIDENVIGALIQDGKVTRYSAEPGYQGNSFIPSVLNVRAWDPGDFTTRIAIWGEALDESD